MTGSKTWVVLVGMLLVTGALAVAGEGDEKLPPMPERRERDPGTAVEMARRPFLGVELVEIGDELAAHFGAANRSGVLVGHVVPDSPAARAGVQVGDVITGIDGADVEGAFGISRRLREKREGDDVTVDVVRDGGPLSLHARVELRERPALDLSGLGLLKGELADGELLRRRIGRAVDPKVIDDAVKRATAFLESPEWKAKVSSMQRIESDVDGRMKRLEERLKQLEKQLEEKK